MGAAGNGRPFRLSGPNLKLATGAGMPRSTSRATEPRSTQTRGAEQTGTGLAIICPRKSKAAIDGKLASAGHGGARLRADRTSDHLKAKQARAIMLAALAAERIGQPFTRMVTVHWERAGIPDHAAAAATGRLVKLATDWARRQGARIHWAWTRENDHGKGSHLHLLIACPRSLPIGRMWRRWLRAITGQPYRGGVVNTRRIGGALSTPETDRAAYHANLFTAIAYICKGVRPEDAADLRISRLEPGGKVTGKRAAVCQALLHRRDNENIV